MTKIFYIAFYWLSKALVYFVVATVLMLLWNYVMPAALPTATGQINILHALGFFVLSHIMFKPLPTNMIPEKKDNKKSQLKKR